jgi:Sugar transferases involved in lipopolysaccharide synthesis
MVFLRLNRAYFRFAIDALLPLAILSFFGFDQPLLLLAGPCGAAILYAFGYQSSRMDFKLGELTYRLVAGNIVLYALLLLLSLIFDMHIVAWRWCAAAALTIVIPFFTWRLANRFVAKPVARARVVQLRGNYPSLATCLEEARLASGKALDFRMGESSGAMPEDFPVLMHWLSKTIKRVPVELIETFPDAIKWKDRTWYDPFKRLADILVSAVCLVILSPFMAIIALIIKLEDGDKVVFAQQRVGKGGAPFTMYKFRSMSSSGFKANDPNGNIEQRILKIGGFIRKTRLDETLQFVNILKGDMSFIGPRPEMQHYHDMAKAGIPEYERRLTVKPGITGWAQTAFSHTSSLDEYRIKTSYDFYYLLKRNPFFDFQILLKTVGTVITLAGAR